MKSLSIFINQKKSLRGLISWGLLIFVAGYICYYLTDSTGKINFSINDLKNLVRNNYYYVIMLVVLSPVNSFVEAKKWQCSLHSLVPDLSVKNALKMIYAGAAAGLVTPSKIGEYGGRMIGLNVKTIPGAFIANFYCSLAQNLVNLWVGFGGILMINQILYKSYHFLTVSFITMSGISSLVLVMIFYHLDFFIQKGIKSEMIKKYLSWLRVDQMPELNKDKILFYSFLRYGVYLFQYLLVVQILGFEAGLIEKVSAIGIIFMLQSVIILPSIMGFVARVEIAVFVWSVTGMVQGEVLLAVLFLWVVNLALPAAIGGVWLLFENKIVMNEKLD